MVMMRILIRDVWQCSWQACGKKGRQARPVYCQDMEGITLRKKLCREEVARRDKPKRKRRCVTKPCKCNGSCQLHDR